MTDAVVVPADQVIYAVTNLVPLLPLSQTLDKTEFGEVALAQSLVVGLAVLGRAFFATPFLAMPKAIGVRSSSAARLSARAALVAAAGALGLVALSAVPALPLPGPATMALLSFGLPAAFLIDIKRMSFIRADRATSALAIDVVWLVAEVGLLGIGWLIGLATAGTAAASWSVGAVLAAGVGFALAGRLAPDRDVLDPRFWQLGSGFATEAVLLVTRVQGYFFALALISGAAALGGVRFAFALVAPVNTALAGWRTFATGQFREQTAHRLSPLIVWPPLAVATALVLVAAIVPDRTIDAISGSADASPYLLFVAAAVALSAIDILVQALLSSRGQTNLLWMARVIEVSAWLVLLLVVRPDEPTDIGRLLLVSAVLGTLTWLAMYGRSTRQRRTAPIERNDPLTVP